MSVDLQNIGIRELVKLAYKRTDEYVAELTAKAATPEYDIHVACKAGCAACCTYIVTADHAEAEVIAEAIQLHVKRDLILGRLMTWVVEWGRHSGNDLFGAPSQNVIDWQVRHKACPFLDKQTHLCMIYSVRPIACRAYHACYTKPDDTNPCNKCEPPNPPDDCFTTPEHAKHGHAPWVFQMDSELITKMSWDLAELTGVLNLGVMPIFVWNIGKRKYNWHNLGIKMRPLYVMQNTRL